uniref:Intronic protein n=1 Tax=Cyclocybe aegerita TaxID=1973307 RepID=Q9XKZ0_CYCAE|nr:intronic protein [Cyclocybe aegerita]
MSFGQKYELFALYLGELFTFCSVLYLKYKVQTKAEVPYYDMFYELNKDNSKYIKIVPQNIIEYMNPIVLAYLIMTDGNFDKGRNRVRIYTNSYSKEEVERLAFAINTKLNIYTGVLHDRNNQWILTIGAKNLTLPLS